MEEEICEKKGSDTEAQPLEERVFHLLREKGLTLSTAESCTGGLVAARIVNVPGSSEVLKAGLITYTNKMKRKYLGVKKSTLRKYTAVSKKKLPERWPKGAAGRREQMCACQSQDLRDQTGAERISRQDLFILAAVQGIM